MNKSRKRLDSPGLEWTGIGFEFAGIFLGCVAFGWWIDQQFWPSYHWALLLFLFIGFFAALLHILLRAREMEDRESQFDAAETPEAAKSESISESVDRLEAEINTVEKKYKDFFKE
ncbi:MAG: AtpZ/AtpI family protein [Leptospiraceae bacterium]|nr:AtpZ/AtpI family protein [Leptospiraceae bacterium]